VVLDPGHDGGNAARPDVLARQVEAGNGRTKACNTVGTSTAAGYPEHAFAWEVSVRARALLAARGVRVVLTRRDDRGVGPCVDVRGRFGNVLRADAVVSVHADGAAPSGSGFHVIEAVGAPGGATVRAASHRLALAVHGGLRSGSGLRPASYVAGGDGFDVRGDLAGLNLSTRPSVVVEYGNMHNPRDAALQSSPAGRQRMAAALAAGVLAYLGRR
jgi:N-acetylmuramoyl-L-alanine amidase